jgi:hypothetical protein
MKGISPVITVIFLAAFIYYGWTAGWWAIMGTWTANDWAVFFLGMLISWIARNEFEHIKS